MAEENEFEEPQKKSKTMLIVIIAIVVNVAIVAVVIVVLTGTGKEAKADPKAEVAAPQVAAPGQGPGPLVEMDNFVVNVQSEEGAKYLKAGLAQLGLDTGHTQTPIVPVMLGDVKLAKAFSARLFENSVFAMALGFPTVPRGKARIRVMNTAAHTRQDIDFGLAAFERVARELKVI